MNEKYTPIERKTQADYDQIATAFAPSRRGMKWPEVTAFLEEIKDVSSVLDIGCGTGRLCGQLTSKSVRYTGVDLSEGQLEQARAACPEGVFEQASMLHLPFEDDSFDIVLHIAALHHLFSKEERQQAMQEAARVLKPGGKMLLTVKSLWQPSYWQLFFSKGEGSKQLSEVQRKKIRWNDVFWIWKWGLPKPVYRYYHAFTKRELMRVLPDNLDVTKSAYVKNGRTVSFLAANNLVIEATKKLY